MKSCLFVLLMLQIALLGCKKPYQPPVTLAPTNYLVVEGTINSNNNSTDSTIFKLSRTVNLKSNTSTINPELHAQITIEGEQGYTFTLKENGKGYYVAGSLGLDTTKKYRVRIKTADSKIYLSNFEPVVYAPPIDSIGFTASESGIQLYVNTHNPLDNTRYYRWDFAETWKIVTLYTSEYVTNGYTLLPRTPAQDVHTCWASDVSTGIMLGSSIKLTHDVIYHGLLTPIASNSEKLSVRYSILVKQYGLTADAFSFWDQLRKNTETLGSIFDTQPSATSGNIHCISNPAEQVFGYVGTSNIQTKRVYINRMALPADYRTDIYNTCAFHGKDTVLDFQIKPYMYTPNDLIPVSSPYIPLTKELISLPPDYSVPIPGYFATKKECGDCTTRGTVNKPAFWVDQ
jgi:hypothetical protein